MQKVLQQKLIEHWTKALTCNLCNLPKPFTPQFRPIGDGYKIGGVAFIQINPGVMGTKPKNSATTCLQKIESEFLKSQSLETWNNLRSEYFKVMRDVWGWPPGRYAKTIENHGVRLENVAVVNLAQCPMEENNYPQCLLNKCWKNRTSQLLEILRPKIIVAQGKTVLNYLKKHYTNRVIDIVEGVHHASRVSKKDRDDIFKEVKNKLGAV